VSVCVAIACLWRVLTLPDAPRLLTALQELAAASEEQHGQIHTLRTHFARLESDVTEHLEEATSRLKRASTREANVRRRQGNGADGSPPDDAPSIDQLVAQADLDNWKNPS